jgi:glyceraldehyde-3-phosphate dehydrogenase/erythrose-4-phosphate dehydrogenase
VSIRLAINGLGRTGRRFLCAAAAWESSTEVVAVNDLGKPSTMVNLMRRDSVFGTPAGSSISSVWSARLAHDKDVNDEAPDRPC